MIVSPSLETTKQPGNFLSSSFFFFADGGEVIPGDEDVLVKLAGADLERGVSLEESVGRFHLPGGGQDLDAIDDTGRLRDLPGFGFRFRFGF